MFDTKLFKYDIKDKKYKRYSKGCQSSIEYKQPVILDYDPLEESKKKDSIVERDSFTYTFRYVVMKSIIIGLFVRDMVSLSSNTY